MQTLSTTRCQVIVTTTIVQCSDKNNKTLNLLYFIFACWLSNNNIDSNTVCILIELASKLTEVVAQSQCQLSRYVGSTRSIWVLLTYLGWTN